MQQKFRTVELCRQYEEADNLVAERCGFWMYGICLVRLFNSFYVFCHTVYRHWGLEEVAYVYIAKTQINEMLVFQTHVVWTPIGVCTQNNDVE
jgi:hypothetical protein